jgi:hypothetical protein
MCPIPTQLPCRDEEDKMATATVELSDMLKGIPSGAWVAISERLHKVVAYGVDPQAVLNESHSKGEERPLIVRVPDQNSAMFL